VYTYFFERFHWTPEQLNQCPLYLACIEMGAISPDHERLFLSDLDRMRYFGSKRRG